MKIIGNKYAIAFLLVCVAQSLYTADRDNKKATQSKQCHYCVKLVSAHHIAAQNETHAAINHGAGLFFDLFPKNHTNNKGEISQSCTDLIKQVLPNGHSTIFVGTSHAGHAYARVFPKRETDEKEASCSHDH